MDNPPVCYALNLMVPKIQGFFHVNSDEISKDIGVRKPCKFGGAGESPALLGIWWNW